MQDDVTNAIISLGDEKKRRTGIRKMTNAMFTFPEELSAQTTF